MNTPLLLSTAALLVGGGALALQLRSDSAPRPLPLDSVSPEVPALDPRRIDALEDENRALRDRLAMLEQEASGTVRRPVEDYITRSELDALREELLGGAAVTKSSAPLEARKMGELKEQVASTLDTLRQEEAAAKREAERERYTQRLDKAMPTLEAQLGLTSSQSDRLRTELEAQRSRGEDLYRRWQEGEDPQVLGELKGSQREEHQAALQGILDTTQLEGLRPALREVGLGGK